MSLACNHSDPTACMILTRTVRWRLASFSSTAVLVALIGLSACGPDLTTPGEGNVSGTWFAAGPAAGMTNITMILRQTADGLVTGSFTATGTHDQQVCPKIGPCVLASTIDGANTVLQVNLELLDAGTFTGQLIGETQLRGTMTRGEQSLMEFNRTSVP